MRGPQRTRSCREMRIWLWLACAAFSGAGPSPIIEAAGASGIAGHRVGGGYTLGPSVDGRDRDVLSFSGERAEAGAGKLDIYRVRYAPRRAH